MRVNMCGREREREQRRLEAKVTFAGGLRGYREHRSNGPCSR